MFVKENIKELKEQAAMAFDSSFRDQLCNAVQLHVLSGGKIGNQNSPTMCKCPEGCLFKAPDTDDDLLAFTFFPGPTTVLRRFGFSYSQHSAFQTAFDIGYYDGTPEAALGLLYRFKFGVM